MRDKNCQMVVNNELCFGCGTCNVVCPVRAICMEFSSIGRLIPEINENACIRCGLCVKACPGIDLSGKLAELIDSTLLGEVKEVLYGRSANEETFNNAQSGGAATETIAYLLDEGRINAALVVVQEKQHAKYRIVTASRDLFASQTSQYTPVDLLSGLPLLMDYQHVAVVGIPCHIEGIVKLKEQFPNKFTNIEYLIGLICAGTQSQLMVDVVKRVGEKRIGPIAENDEVRWRQKKFSNYKRADIAIVSSDGKVRMLENDIRHTAKKYLSSPRCKLCFDKLNLYADIVYGDAWGVNGIDTKQGGNIIVCRTDKGKSLIDEMMSKERLVGCSCPIEDVLKGQGMPKKKKMVDSMMTIYSQKNWRLPGWIKGDVFKASDKNIETLKKDVGNYMARSKRKPEKVIREVAKKINRQLMIIDVKKFLRKIINK